MQEIERNTYDVCLTRLSELESLLKKTQNVCRSHIYRYYISLVWKF